METPLVLPVVLDVYHYLTCRSWSLLLIEALWKRCCIGSREIETFVAAWAIAALSVRVGAVPCRLQQRCSWLLKCC